MSLEPAASSVLDFDARRRQINDIVACAVTNNGQLSLALVEQLLQTTCHIGQLFVDREQLRQFLLFHCDGRFEVINDAVLPPLPGAVAERFRTLGALPIAQLVALAARVVAESPQRPMALTAFAAIMAQRFGARRRDTFRVFALINRLLSVPNVFCVTMRPRRSPATTWPHKEPAKYATQYYIDLVVV